MERILDIIIRWKEIAAEVVERVKARLEELRAYPRAIRMREELRKEMEKLSEEYKRGAISTEEYWQKMKELDEAYKEQSRVISSVKRKYTPILRTLQTLSSIALTFAWRMGIMGWILSYHMRRIFNQARSIFRFFLSMGRRIYRFLKRTLRDLALFPSRIEEIAQAMGWLAVIGQLTAERQMLLTMLIYKLVEIGPYFAALWYMIAAGTTEFMVAIGEGVKEHIPKLLDLIEKLMRSPLLQWLTDIADRTLAYVLPSLEALGEELSKLPTYLPAEELARAIGSLAQAFSHVIGAIVPFTGILVSVIDRLAEFFEKLAEWIPVILPKLERVFNVLISALEQLIPLLPPIIESFAMFLKISIQLFSILLKVVGPTGIALLMLFNALGPLLVFVISVFQALIQVFALWLQLGGQGIGILSALGGAFSFLASHPLALVVVAIIAVITALVTLYYKCEWFRNAVNGIGRAIANSFQWMGQQIQAAFQSAARWISQHAEKILAVLSPLPYAIAKLLSNINWEGVKQALSNLGQSFWKFKDDVVRAFQSLLTGVQHWWNQIVSVSNIHTCMITDLGLRFWNFQWDVTKAWQAMWRGAQYWWNALVNLVTSITDHITHLGFKFYGFQWDITQAWQAMWRGAQYWWDATTGLIYRFIGLILHQRFAFWDFQWYVTQAWQSLWEGVKYWWQSIYDTIKNFVGDIWDAIQWLIDQLCLAHAFHNMYESILADTERFKRELYPRLMDILNWPPLAMGLNVPVSGGASVKYVYITMQNVNLSSEIDIRALVDELNRRLAE